MFQEENLSVIRLLKEVCDRALELSVGLLPGRSCFSDPSYDKEDLCTTHAFQYPNIKGDGFSPQLPGILVKEHTDKSMFVAEFCPLVRGLEIFDPFTKEWFMAEDCLSPGKDLIVFAGEAIASLKHLLKFPIGMSITSSNLLDLTHSSLLFFIEPCLHRVVESPGLVRHCFIFEQKYADYMLAGKEQLFSRQQLQTWNSSVLTLQSQHLVEDAVNLGLYCLQT